ncbi:unnamed protein product [Ectocarpus sp. 6 AP-2014]
MFQNPIQCLKRRTAHRGLYETVATQAEADALEDCVAMNWVKLHMIEGFCPLSYGDKRWVRESLNQIAAKDFPLGRLHKEAVAKMVVEYYAATTAQFKAEIAAEVGGVPRLHLDLDLWVDKSSTLMFMGVRLFYIDREWRLKSRLLAVRQFNPTPEMFENERLSALLEKYLTDVLEEFGLDVSMLFSATSDAGSDVKHRLCHTLIPRLWKSCVCHMLNCSLVEAIGTRVNSRKPGNLAARKVVLAVKKVVEHIRRSKSPGARAIFQEEQVRHYSQCLHRKLINVAPQRWSGVSGVLEATIVNRVGIDGVYAREGSVNPLAPHENEIDELYSLIKPVAELIVKCQQTHVPTGQAAVLGLAALKLSTFNVDARLDVLTPARAQGRPEGTGGGERKATSVPRLHNHLTQVGRDAREHLASALDRRYFDRCYKPADSEKTTDFVFDMQMGLHPTTADLQYVDKLTSTEVHAAFVKKSITDKVIALAVELAEKEMERKQAGPEQGESVAKRARPAAAPGSLHPAVVKARNKKDDEATAKFASLGLFKKRGGGGKRRSSQRSSRWLAPSSRR